MRVVTVWRRRCTASLHFIIQRNGQDMVIMLLYTALRSDYVGGRI